MKKHQSRLHILLFELAARIQLALPQIELIDDFDSDVNCLSCLLEFYAHLVYSIDDPFAAL